MMGDVPDSMRNLGVEGAMLRRCVMCGWYDTVVSTSVFQMLNAPTKGVLNTRNCDYRVFVRG